VAKKQRETEVHLREQWRPFKKTNPSNLVYQGQLSDIGERLGEFEKHQVEGLKVQNRIQWKRVEDAFSKEFFLGT